MFREKILIEIVTSQERRKEYKVNVVGASILVFLFLSCLLVYM